MADKIISVLKDFSEFPGLRNCNISDNSGEEFYHKVLNRAFKDAYEQGIKLTVILDNTAGYASSFLDEAFGNLVYDFTLDNAKKYIEIISNQEPHWKDMIENETFVQWESRRQKSEEPVVTKQHEPWFRFHNGKIESAVWEQPATAA